jgi:UrcA family protein
MYIKTNHTSGRLILGAVAVACALVGGNVVARDRNVTVAIHVSTQGLDLNRAADAQKFYARLKTAAWVACTDGNRVDLVEVDNVNVCFEKALAGAVRSVKVPALTQIYLETHTLQEAAKQGVVSPAQLAAK